jgi:predicted secreted protein
MKIKNILSVFVFVFVSSLVVASHARGLEIEDEGRPIEVKAGQEFTIKLQSNATTGYQWKIDGKLDEKVVKFVRSDYKALPVKMMGAGGWEFWIFKAEGQGTTKINMIYIRPWEKQGFKEKTKTFSVIVR